MFVLNSAFEIVFKKEFWPVKISKRIMDELRIKINEYRRKISHLTFIGESIDFPGEFDIINEDHMKLKFVFETFAKNCFVIYSDPTENVDELYAKIKNIRKLFIQRYGLKLYPITDPEQINELDKILNEQLVSIAKISIIGLPGVGKTTIARLVATGDPSLEYSPTIQPHIAHAGASISDLLKHVNIKEDDEWLFIGNKVIVVHDMPGQRLLRGTWNVYLRGTDGMLLVVKSLLSEVLQSKKVLEFAKSIVPDAIVWAIANFQDLPNALPPKVVEKLLGVPTFGMVAIDPSRRDEMIAIIRKLCIAKEKEYLK